MRNVTLALAAVALVACSNSPQQSGSRATSAPPSGAVHVDGGARDAAPGTSAQADDAGDDDASANDGHLCVILSNAGASIRENRIASDPPQPTGGAVLVGTYELVAYNTYTGAGGATGQTSRTHAETLLLDGVDWEEVVQSGNGTDALRAQPIASSGSYSTGGNTLTMTITCPTYADATFTYSALASELHIFSDTVERVYRMQ